MSQTVTAQTAPPQSAGIENATERVRMAWQILNGVPDPEVPVLSVVDLGLVRGVDEPGGAAGALQVVLTPTYSGCPATEVIEASVVQALQDAGLGPVQTRLQRAPAWSSDWMSAEGRRKLREYGIAPPGPVERIDGTQPLHWLPRGGWAAPAVDCPRCGSAHTERLSAFGSTACKALYRCLACREPFEHFKPL